MLVSQSNKTARLRRSLVGDMSTTTSTSSSSNNNNNTSTGTSTGTGTTNGLDDTRMRKPSYIPHMGPCELSMYTSPPTHELTLPIFEQYGLDRLAILRLLETGRASGSSKSSISDELTKLLGARHYDFDHEKDNTSHFILRLAFCRSADSRKWFLTHECMLFRHRFDRMTNPDQLRRFFAKHNMQFSPLTLHDMDNDLQLMLRRTLRAVTRHKGHKGGTGTSDHSSSSSMMPKYYKVPFEEAYELVGRRRVYVQDGFAYVPQNDLVSIIVAKFRAHLSRELVATYRNHQSMRQDNRLRPLLATISKRSVAPSYKPGMISGSVTPDQVPYLANRSFPLCMQNMQQNGAKNSHLRYNGRRIYGLFLKGIGLSLQDSLNFWRRLFSRKVTPEKFNKEYAYNVRHNYGQEGSRQDYKPASCLQIINKVPGAGEHHGCPFASFDEHSMRSKLLERKVPVQKIDDVMKLVRGKHYQIACREYFKIHHPNSTGDAVGAHPNKYFEESMKYWRAHEQQQDQKGQAITGNIINSSRSSTITKTTGVAGDVGMASASASSSSASASAASSSSSQMMVDSPTKTNASAVSSE
jgi:DNA primase large subunit